MKAKIICGLSSKHNRIMQQKETHRLEKVGSLIVGRAP